jgi:hypothetical protein
MTDGFFDPGIQEYWFDRGLAPRPSQFGLPFSLRRVKQGARDWA